MLRLLILTYLLITSVLGFSTNLCLIAPSIDVKSGNFRRHRHPNVPTTPKRRRTTIHLFSSTRDEEIAKLEAQLRQLRESETAVGSEDDTSAATLDPDDVRTLKAFADARRRLEKVKGKDMLLTEQELIKGGLLDDSSNNSFGGVVPAIAVVVAAFVGIIAFAQIPIGQEDLARYSATGSSTLKSIDLGDLNSDVVNRL